MEQCSFPPHPKKSVENCHVGEKFYIDKKTIVGASQSPTATTAALLLTTDLTFRHYLKMLAPIVSEDDSGIGERPSYEGQTLRTRAEFWKTPTSQSQVRPLYSRNVNIWKPSGPAKNPMAQTEWERKWQPYIESLYQKVEEPQQPPPRPAITPLGNVLPYPHQSSFGASNVPEIRRAVCDNPIVFPKPRFESSSAWWRKEQSPTVSITPKLENTVRFEDFRSDSKATLISPPKLTYLRLMKRSPGQGVSHAIPSSPPPSPTPPPPPPTPPPAPTTSNKRKDLIPTRFDEPVDSPARLNKRMKRFREDLGTNSSVPQFKREARVPTSLNMSLEEIIEKKNISPPPRRHSFQERWDPVPNPNRKYLFAKRQRINSYSRNRMRPVVIDGSNVAHACGKVNRPWMKSSKETFDCNGIRICVDHFLRMGCTDITVVIPEAKLYDRSVINDYILQDLQNEGRLVLSCSKQLHSGRWVSSYDDRFILNIAERKDGIIVSNDRFGDLRGERRTWNYLITQRRVGFTFYVGQGSVHFYVPPDPSGRHGKSLEELLTITDRSRLG